MALTGDQKIAVFQILGLPTTRPQDFDTNLQKRVWVDNVGGWPAFPYQYETTAIDAVNARIAELTADEESAVSDIIDQFEAIKYQTVRVKTDKIDLSYDKQRAQLRKLMLAIIPIKIKDLAGQGSTGGGNPLVSIG